MKLTILCALIATLCAGCASNERRAPSGDALAALPADPQQKAPPRWVKAVPPYSLTLFSKAEVDLNSVRENGDGAITAWERDTYEKIQNPSTSYSYKVAEAHYLFDCAGGKFSILHVNTRRANGDLVRSQPLSDGEQQNRQDIFAHSLIGAEAELACAQAHSNWPNDARYPLRIKPETPIAANSGISGMTPEQKKSIENSVRQLRQSQAASAATTSAPPTRWRVLTGFWRCRTGEKFII
ncbi:surface-adhesin E family protein [Trinickia diaoshuihuensis]|uniref:surface-adhesin E family protein n=1 Tax=Trinickia diaoshuihuensis TaxID=2292265 RepID=UPI000E25CC77